MSFRFIFHLCLIKEVEGVDEEDRVCSRLKRQFVWREGAGNDFVVGYTGHWGSFLELSKTIDFVAAIGTVLLGVVGEICN